MMSSKQRTYSQRRKDLAEEKFDALFSKEAITAPIRVEIKGISKRKLHVDRSIFLTKKLRLNSGLEFSSGNCTSRISDPSIVHSTEATCIDCFTVPSFVKVPELSGFGITKSMRDVTIANHNEGSTNLNIDSKYDMLFKKSEQSASEKFDAVFGEEVKPFLKSRLSKVAAETNQEFNNSVGDCGGRSKCQGDVLVTQDAKKTKGNNDSYQKTSDKSKIYQFSLTKSPTNTRTITGATMKTVDGKVVINFQKRTKSPKLSSDNLKAFSFLSQNSEKQDDVDAKKVQTIKPTSVASAKEHTSKSISASSSLITNNKLTYLVVPSVLQQQPASKPSYNSRPWMNDSEESSSASEKEVPSSSQADSTTDEFDIPTPKITRSITWPEKVGDSIITSIKCNKAARGYFQVVRHVKNYQNCLEEGEAQEFSDEISYLLEGLQPSQPLSVRCLSLTNLAHKCLQANFRLYLRAHNISDKIFSHLQDVKENQALALSTAALLFMLSRDRQIEINKKTLQLLLRLIDPFDKDNEKTTNETKQDAIKKDQEGKYKIFTSKERNSVKNSYHQNTLSSTKKIKEMVDACDDHLLTGEDVSVKRLASEALLRFTARKTMEWFREEVRLKGGLDHIISLVKSYVETTDSIAKQTSEEGYEFKAKRTLCTLERLLKVLENAIVNSQRNAMYLVTHQRAILLKKMSRLMALCKSWLLRYPFQHVDRTDGEANSNNERYTLLHNTILQVIKLLVNLSNDNEWISSRVGEQDGMLSSIVECVLIAPTQLKAEHKYQLILLSLSLLVNLVESSAKNRMALMKMSLKSPKRSATAQEDSVTVGGTVIQSFAELFLEREASASENEVLGESGVRKAVEAKKATSTSKSQQPSAFSSSKDHDGEWIETEDGMMWVPSEVDDDEEEISGSQESCRSKMSLSKNPEIFLTAEERNEMQETLDKASEHMEDSIVASYVALVLGCLIYGNRANSPIIRGYLGNAGFLSMTRMLKKFLSFMSLTAGINSKGEKTLLQIIETLEEESSRKA